MAIVKGESFDSSELDVLRIFIWFRQSVLGSFSIFLIGRKRSIHLNFTDAKMFERCNFACLELSGYMVIQRKMKFYLTKIR